MALQYLAPRERLFVTLGSDENVVNMIALHLIIKMGVSDIIVSRIAWMMIWTYEFYGILVMENFGTTNGHTHIIIHMELWYNGDEE